MHQPLSGPLVGLLPDPSAAAMLRDLDHAMAGRAHPRVLLIVGGGAPVVSSSTLGSAYPEAHIEVLDVDDDAWRGTTSGLGRFRVVVDATRRADLRVSLFEQTFPTLGGGGTYLVADHRSASTDATPAVERVLWPRLTALLDARSGLAEQPTAALEGVRPEHLRRVVLDRAHLLVERDQPGDETPPPATGAGLAAVAALVEHTDVPRVVVVGGARADKIAERLAERLPEAHVVALRGRKIRAGRTHAALAAYGPLDLLLDLTGDGDSSRRLFSAGFLHLRAGGHLVVVDPPVASAGKPAEPDRAFWPYLVRLIGRRGPSDGASRGPAADERNRAAAVVRIEIGRRHLMLTNGTPALAVLRDEHANDVARRRTDGSVRLVEHRPALRFESRATLGDHSAPRSSREPESYQVPALSMREYRDVVCRPGQVAVLGNLVLPETFRHGRYPRLKNRGLVPLTRWFTYEATPPEQRLEGSYYHLDGELRHHFGHFTSENVARLWGWPAAKAADPDLRLLMSSGLPDNARSSWELEFLEAAGVARQDVVSFSQPVHVERLVGVTPMFSMPSYVHPDITETWTRIGDALEQRAAASDAARVFITRAPGTHRWCHQTPEVEELFRQRGFTIVRPELLGLPDQIALMRGADVVAGFAGSGMFTSMFATQPQRVIVIRSVGYTPSNEYLIASVRGQTLDLVECVPDVPATPGRFLRAAFESDFSFDLGAQGEQVARILDDLED